MNACTNVLAASGVGDNRTRRSCLSWKKQDRQSDATWSAMLSWPSIRTPRSDTVVENWMDSSVVESLSSCCRVPSYTSCVLSAFILSRLLDIHASTRLTHSTNVWVVVEVDAVCQHCGWMWRQLPCSRCKQFPGSCYSFSALTPFAGWRKRPPVCNLRSCSDNTEGFLRCNRPNLEEPLENRLVKQKHNVSE